MWLIPENDTTTIKSFFRCDNELPPPLALFFPLLTLPRHYGPSVRSTFWSSRVTWAGAFLCVFIVSMSLANRSSTSSPAWKPPSTEYVLHYWVYKSVDIRALWACALPFYDYDFMYTVYELWRQQPKEYWRNKLCYRIRNRNYVLLSLLWSQALLHKT